jgi:DNA-binding NarL/FixJ family response regulator
MVYCLEKVASGVQWIENAALLMAMRQLAQRETVMRLADRLTAREREIARLVINGLTNRDIAAIGIAETTVKMHLGAAFEKPRVASRTQLAAFARDLSLAKQGSRERGRYKISWSPTSRGGAGNCFFA